VAPGTSWLWGVDSDNGARASTQAPPVTPARPPLVVKKPLTSAKRPLSPDESDVDEIFALDATSIDAITSPRSVPGVAPTASSNTAPSNTAPGARELHMGEFASMRVARAALRGVFVEVAIASVRVRVRVGW
jgi:hypothetical protein